MYKLSVYDRIIWNYATVCIFFVSDKNAWYYITVLYSVKFSYDSWLFVRVKKQDGNHPHWMLANCLLCRWCGSRSRSPLWSMGKQHKQDPYNIYWSTGIRGSLSCQYTRVWASVVTYVLGQWPSITQYTLPHQQRSAKRTNGSANTFGSS